MRLKTSKSPPSRPFLWKVAPGCSEQKLDTLARELALELRPGDRILLEGLMGAGKTTFARALIQALGVEQPPEGSPTFAIAHEYRAPIASIVHIDFYRIRSESEIDEAGLPDYFWDPKRIVIAEWVSLWPGFEERVLSHGRNWRVSLEFSSDGDALKRAVRIERNF